MSGLDYALAGGAGILAGAVNAVAGGGTLISFPALQALGLSSVDANITNIVALTPGYLAGSAAQRRDLEGQGKSVRLLGAAAGLGALGGSVLLVEVAAKTFEAVVPFLVLLACAALLAQGRVRKYLMARAARQADRRDEQTRGPWQYVGVFFCSVYGGFFGAGLGIMLLAVLGSFSDDSLPRINALKQALSLIVSVLSGIFLAFTGHVVWSMAGVVAVASLVGGFAGGRVVHFVSPTLLRMLVVVLGVVVAIRFWT